MSDAKPASIHPTAIVAPETQLGDNVQIGPYATIEGGVQIGADCVIGATARLVGPLTLGERNRVFAGAILGERPQDLRFQDEPTRLEIGNDNVFREHVTINRGTVSTGLTKVGNENYFMAGSHVGHDCVIGDRCIFANGALIAGHCEIHDSAYVSGNSGVHQFCRMGRLSMISGIGGTSKDVPPFVVQVAYNQISGVNVVGMRRAGHSNAEINQIRRAFQILFRDGLLIPQAIEKIEHELGAEGVVREFTDFVRATKRGINRIHFAHERDKAA